jgi:predicted enzyme related to lactoylglutathione lyase
MAINNVLASVAVKDLKAAGEWYREVLGKAPDSTPMPELLEWKFSGGGWLQVYHLPERAGHGSFTLAVSDRDEEVRRLTALGIDSRQTTDNPAVKTVMISDPDGNHIAFAQALDASLGQ